MRVKINETGLYTYPDIVATCNEPKFEDPFVDTLLNPAIIIEVLSDSTEAYDRGGNFAHYRRLSSVQEYLLIAQYGICVEHYSRQDERWLLTEISDLAGTPHLDSIDCVLFLVDIYDKVEIANKERSYFIRKND
jgi:Uma2 family endonuclease